MDPMSIANLSTSMANSKTMSQVGMAVMNMAMDSVEAAGAGTVAMINSIPAPGPVNAAPEGHVDISV